MTVVPVPPGVLAPLDGETGQQRVGQEPSIGHLPGPDLEPGNVRRVGGGGEPERRRLGHAVVRHPDLRHRRRVSQRLGVSGRVEAVAGVGADRRGVRARDPQAEALGAAVARPAHDGVEERLDHAAAARRGLDEHPGDFRGGPVRCRGQAGGEADPALLALGYEGDALAPGSAGGGPAHPDLIGERRFVGQRGAEGHGGVGEGAQAQRALARPFVGLDAPDLDVHVQPPRRSGGPVPGSAGPERQAQTRASRPAT